MSAKILCIVRCGAKGIQNAWIAKARAHIDVALSWYEEGPAGGSPAEHFCVGPKWRGVADYFNKNPGQLEEFSHFWFAEDDLYIPEETVVIAKRLAEEPHFKLMAPTLGGGSFYSLYIALSNRSFLFRIVDFVEIMAPIFSKDLLKLCLPTFNDNHSGWGYEWYWQRAVENLGGLTAALDCAPMFHTRPVGGGTLYAGAPAPKEEMHQFLKKHDLQHRLTNFAGAQSRAGGKTDLVWGAELVERAVEGYRYLLALAEGGKHYRLSVEAFVANCAQDDDPRKNAVWESVRSIPNFSASLDAFGAFVHDLRSPRR